MTVTVIEDDHAVARYEVAADWVREPDGGLTIVDAQGAAIVSYGPGEWLSVGRMELAP